MIGCRPQRIRCVYKKDVQRLNFLCTYSFTQTKNALRKQNVFRNSFYTWQMSYY